MKKLYVNQDYIDKEEFHRVVQEIKEFLRNFLDFFLSMELGLHLQDNGFEEWCQKIQARVVPPTKMKDPSLSPTPHQSPS
ncbi:hypothetical protein ACFLUO_09400, partial [Chloroflexota bacterium]